MQFPTSGSQPLEAGDPVQVGAYRLLGRLGHGGMGQVFLGVSRGGRQVAVKVMRPDLVADPEFRARFAREVAAARTVNGFYTAPVVDAAPDATPPWMVTAYVQGPSLAAAVDEHGPLAEPEVRGLAAALAEGLASIHASGLVHRDLKPANIILASDGPRIIDFGIARPVGASTLTAQGTIIGPTPPGQPAAAQHAPRLSWLGDNRASVLSGRASSRRERVSRRRLASIHLGQLQRAARRRAT
jgi:serine/threonine protein kinase